MLTWEPESTHQSREIATEQVRIGIACSDAVDKRQVYSSDSSLESESQTGCTVAFLAAASSFFFLDSEVCFFNFSLSAANLSSFSLMWSFKHLPQCRKPHALQSTSVRSSRSRFRGVEGAVCCFLGPAGAEVDVRPSAVASLASNSRIFFRSLRAAW